MSRAAGEVDAWGAETVGHAEVVMGTVVSFVVVAGRAGPPGARAALGAACAELHRIDGVFSTWKPASPMSRLRRGEVGLGEVPGEIGAVLDACRWAKEVSLGRFDPWALPGGVDPTGYVKGWAAGRARDVLAEGGAEGALVNAGGDVATFGTPGPGVPWQIGIRHPWRGDALAAVIEADGAVATSGRYERGEHLVRPGVDGPPPGAVVSATVVGPDPGLADAWATALAVGGVDEGAWITSQPGYGAYLIGADGSEVTLGPVRFADPGAGDPGAGDPGAGDPGAGRRS